ncbi:MAG: universal stress protein, partial [Microcoleaceae cyanobacterium]
MGFQKIFVALDGSQLGDLVFHQSLDLAKSNQAELMLFHCLPVSLGDAILPMPVELGMYPELVQETYDSQQHRHDNQQATAIAFLKK